MGFYDKLSPSLPIHTRINSDEEIILSEPAFPKSIEVLSMTYVVNEQDIAIKIEHTNFVGLDPELLFECELESRSHGQFGGSDGFFRVPTGRRLKITYTGAGMLCGMLNWVELDQ